MTAWLRADFRGRPRYVWLLCAALLAGALAWWGWPALAGLPLAAAALVRASRWVQPREPSRPDPARDALRAHESASETDRALAGVAAESAARETAGATAAATDPIAEVRARVEGRARR